VEVTPTESASGDGLAELLSGFGDMRRNGNGSVTVQLPGGEAELAEIVRILDRADPHVETLQLHQPPLDDVFLAKTGRKLEGARERPGSSWAATEDGWLSDRGLLLTSLLIRDVLASRLASLRVGYAASSRACAIGAATVRQNLLLGARVTAARSRKRAAKTTLRPLSSAGRALPW
jgi:hypothetical protein